MVSGSRSRFMLASSLHGKAQMGFAGMQNYSHIFDSIDG